MNLFKKTVCLSLLVGCNLVGSEYGRVQATEAQVEMTTNPMVGAAIHNPMIPIPVSSSVNSVQSNASSSNNSRPGFCSANCAYKSVFVLMYGFLIGVLGYDIYVMIAANTPHKYQVSSQESDFIKVLYRPEWHTCKEGNQAQTIVDCIKYVAPGEDLKITSYGDLLSLCATYDAWDNLHQKCADKDKLKTHSTWCVHDDLTFTPGECPSSINAHNVYTSNDLSPEFVQPNLRGSK